MLSLPLILALTLGSATFPARAVDADAASATADKFDRLQREFTQLQRYLMSRRGVGSAERAELQSLRGEIEAFSAAHPDDPRPIALDLQIGIWLGEDERVDASFERLLAMQPENAAIRRRWAQTLSQRNDWPRIVEVLSVDEAAIERTPELAIERARALMNLNRYAEAIAAIVAISEAARLQPGIAGQAEGLATQLEGLQEAWIVEQALREQEATLDLPLVRLETSRGPIVLELFEEQAPYTVANFISLIERGFYDGTRFHRVIPGFMAQGGDPNTRAGAEGAPGMGGPGYTIPDEHSREDRRRHFAGSLAMAKPGNPNTPGRTQPNSAGSQFYVTVAPTQHLDGDYTVFGRIVEGEAALRMLRAEDELLSAAVLRKRDREYVPIRLGVDEEAPQG
jgi:cyclophilin family peptidyl-prolyl cis-trans isomerase